MSSGALVLVKQAMPDIVPDIPARRWRLSDGGRAASRTLARRLANLDPAAVITSDEPKAVETGEIIAAELGLVCQSAPGLHEHDRLSAPFLGQADSEATMESFFQQLETLVFGSETAIAARDRFARAVDRVMLECPEDALVVVTHGTVISLYVSLVAGIEPFPLWRRLGLPSFVVLEWPGRRVVSTVDSVV